MSEVAASCRKLLLLEEDVQLRARLAGALSLENCAVSAIETSEEALREASAQAFDFAVIDPGADAALGRELLVRLKASNELVRIVIFTAYGRSVGAVQSLKNQGVVYLQKPADADDISRALGLRFAR